MGSRGVLCRLQMKRGAPTACPLAAAFKKAGGPAAEAAADLVQQRAAARAVSTAAGAVNSSLAAAVKKYKTAAAERAELLNIAWQPQCFCGGSCAPGAR